MGRMRVGVALLGAMLSAVASGTPGPDATHAKADETVATFARLPFIERPTLSPDGRSLAGLFAVDGRQIVGVQSLFGEARFRGFRLGDQMQVGSLRWVNDRYVLVGVRMLLPVETQRIYVTRLVVIDTATGKQTPLLSNLGGQNGGDVLWVPSDGGTQIVVAAQASVYMGADFWPSVYRVDVATGRSSRIVEARDGVSDWFADERGNVRAGVAYQDNSRTFRLLYRGPDGGTFRIIDAADTRRRQALLAPFLFLPGTTHALTMHDDEQGRSALYETDLTTRGDVRTVLAMPAGSAEVADPILSRDGLTLLGAGTTRADETNVWIDPALAELQRQFDKAVTGRHARIVSLSADRRAMLVIIDDADMPGALWYYNVDGGVLHRIGDVQPAIGARRLSPVRLVHYHARDGLEIEALLTTPAGAAPRGLPLVVMPHGGPWAQDTMRYDYLAQFVAAKGYAVLQPNFRGSTGYGTAFLRRGEGQLGLAMEDDLDDAVRWAADEGIADAKRVCIVGASYGGYAAMWGIARDPARYRCAASISGVSELRREVAEFGNRVQGGKFRDDWRRMTPDFAAVSPIGAVDRIATPLLLIHGKRDVTVDVSQSTRMADRMRGAGKTVEFVALPLADHYFTREPDRTTMLAALGAFLDRYDPAGPAAKP